jgi:hypothetical protein
MYNNRAHATDVFKLAATLFAVAIRIVVDYVTHKALLLAKLPANNVRIAYQTGLDFDFAAGTANGQYHIGPLAIAGSVVTSFTTPLMLINYMRHSGQKLSEIGEGQKDQLQKMRGNYYGNRPLTLRNG